MYVSTVIHCYLADGQKIAKKLSLQISKETQKIKELLPEFNACHVVVGKHEPLQLEEALDSSKLTTIVHPHSSSSKRELIVHTLLYIKRAGEEISMVAMEMIYNYTLDNTMYMKLVPCRVVFSNTAKKQMHSAGEVFHFFMVFSFVLVKSMIYFLSLVYNSSTTSMPVIPGGTASDSDEEVLVKD